MKNKKMNLWHKAQYSLKINFMKRIVALFCLSFLLVFPVTGHSAEEEPELDSSDYSYGEVVSATDQAVAVLEYDYESDEEKAVSYNVTPQTVLTNVGKVTELVKGDTVEVYFKDADGAKSAQMIIKDDTANPDDDQTPAP